MLNWLIGVFGDLYNSCGIVTVLYKANLQHHLNKPVRIIHYSFLQMIVRTLVACFDR